MRTGSEIAIAPLPFSLGQDLERPARLDLRRELLNHLAPIGTDPAPIPHEHHGPEEVPLDQERVEPRDLPGRLGSTENESVLDRRLFVGHLDKFRGFVNPALDSHRL